MSSRHTPVLLQEVVEYLAPKTGEVLVDGTMGFAGHAQVLAMDLGSEGVLVGFDEDSEALAAARENLADINCQTIFIHDNFRHMADRLAESGVTGADKILFDLGVNSAQLDSPGRGFSFRRDEPLVMTLSDKTGRLTAGDLVNELSAAELSTIFSAYGEERFAERIAENIVEARAQKPIKTTGELVAVIERSVPASYRNRRIHPATKTFQALRIAANDELEALREGLAGAWQILKPGGRLAVISFHSLEARIVKNFFKEKQAEEAGRIISKHAVKPTRAEVLRNPRSRSAELRIIEKVI